MPFAASETIFVVSEEGVSDVKMTTDFLELASLETTCTRSPFLVSAVVSLCHTPLEHLPVRSAKPQAVPTTYANAVRSNLPRMPVSRPRSMEDWLYVAWLQGGNRPNA